MTFTIKLLSVGGIATGAIGTGIAGTYYSSLKTIESQLKGKLLGNYDTFRSAWEYKLKRLKEEGNSLGKDLKKIQESSNGKDLALYCQKNYSSTYKSFFSKENSGLLEETKKWCIQSFKDQLRAELGANGKVLNVDSDSEDKDTFKTNYEKLKTHNEKTEGPLPEELKSLSPSASSSTSEQNWQKLQSHCKVIHSKYLTVETLEDFKVAKKYCIKASS